MKIIQFTQKVDHKCRITAILTLKKSASNRWGCKAEGIIQKTIIQNSRRFFLLY